MFLFKFFFEVLFSERKHKLWALLLFSATLLSCSNSYVENIERSGGYEYKPGFPEVRLVAAGIVDEYTDSTTITITAEIVYGSLVFKSNEDSFTSNILIDVQILNTSDPENIIDTKSYNLTLNKKSESLTTSQDEYLFNREYDAEPGTYVINLSVTDLNTNKQTVRSADALIPDPVDQTSHITNIQIFAKDEKLSSTFNPVTTYDISNEADSIQFQFQVTNNKPEDPIVIDTRLIKFRSDTTVARPMSWPNYNSSHISYKGISYSKYEVINTSRRILNQPGSVSIEFLFPNLPRGNYRFEVNTETGENTELFKAREFSVKSVNYPSLKTPKELAAPLYYLMDKKEYEQIMKLEDNVEIKRAIDRFWLKNIKNSKKAQNVIALYYERVEEANKQFAGFKEGWKTDMGMMYILFGPPWYVNSSLDQTVWSYSYNLNDFDTNFYFRTPKIKSKFFPFDNYLLLRTQQYHQVQYQQIQMWLTGGILRDNL